MDTLKTEIKTAVSRKELAEELRKLGVKEGMTLEVHASLSSLGYVIGGAQTAVDALLDAVGLDGTLVMPIQASDNTEPAFWENPPIDRSLWQKIRENTPAYNPDETEFPAMGAMALNLNRRGGAYRSAHPSCAFVTYGKYGKLIAHEQSLNFALGETSPLATMYQLPSYILLLGVDYNRCTGMHLGEYRSNVRPIMLQGSAMQENGYRKWVKYLDIDLDSDEFIAIGKEMENKKMVTVGTIWGSKARLFKFSEAVDFTAAYLKSHHSV